MNTRDASRSSVSFQGHALKLIVSRGCLTLNMRFDVKLDVNSAAFDPRFFDRLSNSTVQTTRLPIVFGVVACLFASREGFALP